MQFRSYRVGVDCFNDCKRFIEVFALKSLLPLIAAAKNQTVEIVKLKSTIQTLYKVAHEKIGFRRAAEGMSMACLITDL